MWMTSPRFGQSKGVKTISEKLDFLVLSGQAVCPCGVLVAGPVVKVTAHKVDVVDQSASLENLVGRAKHEMERVLRVEDEDNIGAKAKGSNKSKKREKMKFSAKDNISNFSNYRNKARAAPKSKGDDSD